MKHVVLTIVAAAIMLVAAGGASAHRLIVTPPGQTEPVVDQGVSRAWAQAHCHAESPEQATASSGGTVAFAPAGPLPCGDSTNPGGQTTGP